MNPEYDEINVKYDLADKGEGYYEVIKDNELARFDGDGRQLWYFKAIESD